jgi:hypothetical protein
MVYTVGRGIIENSLKCDDWADFLKGRRTNTTVGIDLAPHAVRLLVSQVSYKGTNQQPCLPKGRIAIGPPKGDRGSRHQLYWHHALTKTSGRRGAHDGNSEIEHSDGCR